MKYKLIQILLGALGSALTAVIAHYAQVPADAALAASVAAGPASTATLGNIVGSAFASTGT